MTKNIHRVNGKLYKGEARFQPMQKLFGRIDKQPDSLPLVLGTSFVAIAAVGILVAIARILGVL
ncbi:hypothetical protein [Rhizobium sp. SGZ-381]|uniref:hypothetical protein n=1 Tax=Rhizobium sp. SGZ-381 TaxID=3342800 RepID=UPI00366E33F1